MLTGLLSAPQNHTLSLLPAMFYLLRHGRADECAELCRANDQGWRGAALLGGAGGWWVGDLGKSRLLAAGSRGSERWLTRTSFDLLAAADVKGDDDEMITEDVVDVEAGNRTRALWKRIGRAAATNVSLASWPLVHPAGLVC